MYKMESNCLNCRKYTENINPICNSKKSKFINQQKAKGLLSKLGIKTPLSKIPIFGDILF